MKLEPLLIGSIKDRIVCSVWALGELATPASIKQSVECRSPSVLAIAIDGLQRDGYMYVNDKGVLVLADELVAQMPPRDRKPATAVATQKTTATEGATMTKKACVKCTTPKDATEENFGKDSRTEDGLGKTCVKCKRECSTKPKPRKPVASKPAATPATADELVIPAEGQIVCRTEGPSFVLQQDSDRVVASYKQLQLIRDWASTQLKKTA